MKHDQPKYLNIQAQTVHGRAPLWGVHYHDQSNAASSHGWFNVPILFMALVYELCIHSVSGRNNHHDLDEKLADNTPINTLAEEAHAYVDVLRRDVELFASLPNTRFFAMFLMFLHKLDMTFVFGNVVGKPCQDDQSEKYDYEECDSRAAAKVDKLFIMMLPC